MLFRLSAWEETGNVQVWRLDPWRDRGASQHHRRCGRGASSAPRRAQAHRRGDRATAAPRQSPARWHPHQEARCQAVQGRVSRQGDRARRVRRPR